nr:immunoglobulin heavy chain junction region [Macaca mulatta]MOX38550.1 immunoglobulin heavy chain junction region [Macaca mulatta]MOX38599.1 immunoglobulin heavy chain junction region [Macaca mulatta]MOX39130.1 immunoglobulin heavy chain junction region [Macaca mulatta]MOX39479.1 immunoglobulin heavy chain junction region [Macaca mulatta]
CVRVQVEFDVW